MRPDFGTVLAATLTLLGLIIGFSFSMATARYDLRKTMKRQRPMRLGRSMCGRICCRRRRVRGCAICCGSTRICGSGFMTVRD